MNDEGMLVRRGWLEKADAHITKQDAPDAVEYGAASRFYDVRPARLQTAWSQNQAGVWVATARFVVNDSVDNSFTFPVYAPTATSSPGGTAESTRFFVVWRGRWELIAGAGNGGTPTFTSVLNNVGVGFKLSNTAASSITAITDLNVVNGALEIGVGVITLDLTKSNINVVKSIS